MRIWKRTLTNDTPVPAAGMRLFFGQSRGRISHGFVSGLGSRPVRERVIVHNGVEFTWSQVTLLPGAVVEAGVCYRGEPPPWGKVVWLPAPGQLVNDACMADEACRTLAESTLIASPVQIARLRRRFLEHRADILRHQRFFLDLDDDTTPDLFEHLEALTLADVHARGRAIEALQGVLFARVMQRGRSLTSGNAHAAPLPRPGSSEPVRILSALMSGVMRRHYPEVEQEDVESIERAFELFSCGRLRMGGGDRSLPLNGEPNSAFYFLFAEFALLAIEMGVEPAFWSRLVNVFVRTQPLFMHAYGPKDPLERSWRVYGERDLQPVSDGLIDAARACCAELDMPALERCAAENARDAFQL
jgi:hypothetical protein